VIRTAKKLGRLFRMARILARHDALLPLEYAPRAPVAFRILARFASNRGRATREIAVGQRLALAFEQMGPSAIKLGQFLATRPDLIGSEIARGLESLQDRLPPFPDAAAVKIIEHSLGRPLQSMFSEFGGPVAAASIAQVHRAVTTDNPPRRVAVKVLRPGIEAEFQRDFEAFRLAAGMTERFSSEARRLRLTAVVDTLAASVALELDLRMEAAAASELAHNTRDDEDFRVPVLD